MTKLHFNILSKVVVILLTLLLQVQALTLPERVNGEANMGTNSGNVYDATFQVADYGAIAGDSVYDGDGIRKAIDAAVQFLTDNPGKSAVVQLNRGTYYVNPPDGQLSGFHIKYTNKISNLSLQGDHTTILFTDPFQGGISFTNVTNLTVRDLTLDWVVPSHFEGKIVSIDPLNGSFDVKGPPEFKILADPRFLPTFTKAAGVQTQSEVRGADHPLAIKETASLNQIYPLSVTKKDASTNTWTIKLRPGDAKLANNPDEMQVGDSYVLYARQNSRPCFSLNNNTNLLLQDVTVYSAPAGAANLSGSNGITLIRFKVMNKPGRIASANADGTHMQNVRGPIVIDQCLYEGNGDDSLNIYFRPGNVTSVTNASYNNEAVSKIRVNTNSIRPGDTIEIFEPVAGLTRGTAKVVTAVPIQGGQELVLDSTIAGIVTNKDTILDYDETGTPFKITNSIFRNHRRFGVNIRSRGGLIEGNLFQNLQGRGIVIQNEPSWPEGPFSDNIVIRNNRIDHVAFQGSEGDDKDGAAIIVKGQNDTGGLSQTLGQTNITIDHNVITNPPRFAIYVGSASNVSITNNSVQAATFNYHKAGNIAGIFVEHADHVAINNFEMKDTRSALTAGIVQGDDVTHMTVDHTHFLLPAGVPGTLFLPSAVPVWTDRTLNVDAVTARSLQLSWTPPTEANGVTEYAIYRTSLLGTRTTLATVDGNASQYTLTGLNPNTTYNLSIAAKNAKNVWTRVNNPQIKVTTARDSDANIGRILSDTGTLSPKFDPEVTNYTLNVPSEASSVAITPFASSAFYKSLTINGQPAVSGSPFSLTLGDSVELIVTAQDGVTVKTYVMTILRGRE